MRSPMLRPSRSRIRFALVGAVLFSSSVACVGTTGSDLVEFRAFAAGPADADGSPYTFLTSSGFQVTLTRAKLTIGALYLNRSVPISGGQARTCVLPGTYVGEVPGGAVVDMLSSALTPFATPGRGTADRAATGEVWLTSGDVNSVDDKGAVVFDVAGTASRGTTVIPFEGKVSIGKNRVVPESDPARPGANPICKQRIVSPIPVDITLREGGSLVVRVDPRGIFQNVAFDDLEVVSTNPPRNRIPDDNAGQSSANLFRGLRASQGVYDFRFEESAP